MYTCMHTHNNTCINVMGIFKMLDLAFKLFTAAFLTFFISDLFVIPNFLNYFLEYLSLTETSYIASVPALFSGLTPKHNARPLARPDHIIFKTVSCGMAQGSILGPLIYILYMHDALSLLDYPNDMFLYADDILIMSDHLNVEVMLRNLQGKMDRIYHWCLLNKLTINEVKTKYMIVGSGKVEPVEKILINNRFLGKVTHYEYL